MLNCESCGGRKWLAKLNKKTGEQEYHRVKIDDSVEYNLMIYKCWRCGHVQHEVAPFIPIPARGASILYLDVEISKSMIFNYGLRVPSKYINPDNLIHEYYIICWAASYTLNDHIWHDCVTTSEARKWTDRNILQKLQALMKSADILAGHNINAFDLKRINTRLLLNDLEPVVGKKTIDTLKVARSKFAFESNKLDYINGALGLRQKDCITDDDWRAIVTTGDKDVLKKVDSYCRGDVVSGKQMLQKLMKHTGKRDDYGSVKVI